MNICNVVNIHTAQIRELSKKTCCETNTVKYEYTYSVDGAPVYTINDDGTNSMTEMSIDIYQDGAKVGIGKFTGIRTEVDSTSYLNETLIILLDTGDMISISSLYADGGSGGVSGAGDADYIINSANGIFCNITGVNIVFNEDDSRNVTMYVA